jgi:hypothetical protein
MPILDGRNVSELDHLTHVIIVEGNIMDAAIQKHLSNIIVAMRRYIRPSCHHHHHDFMCIAVYGLLWSYFFLKLVEQVLHLAKPRSIL